MKELKDKNGLTESEFLALYNPHHYEQPSLTADIIVFAEYEDGYKVLLIRRGGHPYLGCWALPGGFAEKGELIDETALRELEEETSIKGLNLIPVGFYSTPGRDPRGWVVTQSFVSVIPKEKMSDAKSGDDAADAKWFDIKKLTKEDKTEIFLNNENIKLTATLKKNTNLTGYDIEHSEGLAFDHASMIAKALDILGIM